MCVCSKSIKNRQRMKIQSVWRTPAYVWNSHGVGGGGVGDVPSWWISRLRTHCLLRKCGNSPNERFAIRVQLAHTDRVRHQNEGCRTQVLQTADSSLFSNSRFVLPTPMTEIYSVLHIHFIGEILLPPFFRWTQTIIAIPLKNILMQCHENCIQFVVAERKTECASF